MLGTLLVKLYPMRLQYICLTYMERKAVDSFIKDCQTNEAFDKLPKSLRLLTSKDTKFLRCIFKRTQLTGKDILKFEAFYRKFIAYTGVRNTSYVSIENGIVKDSMVIYLAERYIKRVLVLRHKEKDVFAKEGIDDIKFIASKYAAKYLPDGIIPSGIVIYKTVDENLVKGIEERIYAGSNYFATGEDADYDIERLIAIGKAHDVITPLSSTSNISIKDVAADLYARMGLVSFLIKMSEVSRIYGYTLAIGRNVDITISYPIGQVHMVD